MAFLNPYPDGTISLSTDRISKEDALRQERTAKDILRRLEQQAGLILADEVGMGKTFVALAVASAISLARPDDGPVIVMVPPSLKQKWPKDWSVFFEKCLDRKQCSHLDAALADSGVALLRLLDDPPDKRKEIIFLTHGALDRSLTDEWVKFALIRRALRKRSSMTHVRAALRRFAGRLLRRHWIDRKNPDLWERLLDNPPDRWGRILRRAEILIDDDEPVPKALVDAMEGLNFDDVLDALDHLPLKESPNIDARLQETRRALADALSVLWQAWLRQTRFRSPLLIFDEAHHLKNPTQLSSLFAEEGAQADSEAVSRGPLAGVFSRMLFLTATPFQLGHHELINVLTRFEGVNWTSPDAPEGGKEAFHSQIKQLEGALGEAQTSSLQLERAWGRLTAAELHTADGQLMRPEEWWSHIAENGGSNTDVYERFTQCHEKMRAAELLLRPWVVRHLKSRSLPARLNLAPQNRRELMVGGQIKHDVRIPGDAGLQVDGESLLPFLLAVRAQVALATSEGSNKRAVFAEGLASSYEAYLETRRGKVEIDDDDSIEVTKEASEDWQTSWYLKNLDAVLPDQGDEIRWRHPKIDATIERALKLWWNGEKSLIFCHYRATGRALRRYISIRLEQQILERAAKSLKSRDHEQARGELDKIADQFFDTNGRLRNEATNLLREVVAAYPDLAQAHEAEILEIGLRFLRTPSFLIRYFPLDSDDPIEALREVFRRSDNSGLTFEGRIKEFCRFLAERCVEDERKEFLDALVKIQTGTYRREGKDDDDVTDDIRYLPNVRLANGEVPNALRRRLMLTFNTPFFPEILIASSVLAEGVDLHLDCRFVIHHDLCWNPSTIEQRTGRVDRIGCKAEQAHQPIHVYLPFVTATQDEKMFRVVRDRERWFSVIMGEKYSLDEGSTEKLAERVPFPEMAAKALGFDLSLQNS